MVSIPMESETKILVVRKHPNFSRNLLLPVVVYFIHIDSIYRIYKDVQRGQGLRLESARIKRLHRLKTLLKENMTWFAFKK